MSTKFLPEELFLIAELQKDKSQIDTLKVSNLLMQSIGNNSFNQRLREENPQDFTPKESQVIAWLANFSYKAKHYKIVQNLLPKLEIASSLAEQKQPVADFEKISLNEYGKIKHLASATQDNDVVTPELLNHIYENCAKDSTYREVLDTVILASKKIAQLQNTMLEKSEYKSGDLMMYLTAKTAAINGRQNWLHHEGKLEEALITKYNHAAPIYIKTNEQGQSIPVKSDIWRMQRAAGIEIQEVLGADNFRINPVKLVDKKLIAQLEQVNYGYKKDKNGQDIISNDGQKVKITWQEVMQSRYEDLANAIHTKLTAPIHQMGEIDNNIAQLVKNHQTQVKDVIAQMNQCDADEQTLKLEKQQLRKQRLEIIQNIEIDETRQKELERLIMAADVPENIDQLQLEAKQLNDRIKNQKSQKKNYTIRNNIIDDQIEELTQKSNLLFEQSQVNKESTQEQIVSLRQQRKDIEKQLILNNQSSLTKISNWVGIGALVKGHNSWISENSLRDLSKAMFNANPAEREMICSEFAAKTIAATVDQLSRLTSLDIQAKTLSDKEIPILKNPISASEKLDRIHPERLVKLLQDAGCVENITNPLSHLVRTEDTSISQKSGEHYSLGLPKKILSLLKNADSKDNFIAAAQGAFKVYLEHAKVDSEAVKQVQQQKLPELLTDIHNAYEKQSSQSGIGQKILNVCKVVLEFCKIRTPDKEIKNSINILLDHINLALKHETEKQVVAQLDQKGQQALAQASQTLRMHAPSENGITMQSDSQENHRNNTPTIVPCANNNSSTIQR